MTKGPDGVEPPLPLRSEFLFTLTGTVGSPIEVGVMPQGERRIVPIEGGAFEGPRLRGQVLPNGADWMNIRPIRSIRENLAPESWTLESATFNWNDAALTLRHHSNFDWRTHRPRQRE